MILRKRRKLGKVLTTSEHLLLSTAAIPTVTNTPREMLGIKPSHLLLADVMRLKRAGTQSIRTCLTYNNQVLEQATHFQVLQDLRNKARSIIQIQVPSVTRDITQYKMSV